MFNKSESLQSSKSLIYTIPDFHESAFPCLFCLNLQDFTPFNRGGSRTSTAGGAQVTNEAEGFTEARSAERGRVGEGVTPSRRWGSGGPPPENFWEIASKWCILSAFWGNQYTFFALKIYMKKCVSLNLHIDYSYFFFNIWEIYIKMVHSDKGRV